MIIGYFTQKGHCLVFEVILNHFHHFFLDFNTNKADYYSVYLMKLIYPPWDMPSGLLRGFAFIGMHRGGKDAD